MSQATLRLIAEIYGLEPNDLWAAARRINLRESLDVDEKACILLNSKLNLNKGNYIELSTIWTARKEQDGLEERVWRSRQIGIWFSKRESSTKGQYNWIFLVLIAPLSATGDEDSWKGEDFKFCTKKEENQECWTPDKWKLRELIPRLTVGLDKGGRKYLTKLLGDVLWGWERYFALIRNDIREVCAPPL